MNKEMLNEMIKKIILEQLNDDEIIKEVKRLLRLYVIADGKLEYEFSASGRGRKVNNMKHAAVNRTFSKASRLFTSHFGDSNDTSKKFIALYTEIIKEIDPEYGSYWINQRIVNCHHIPS